MDGWIRLGWVDGGDASSNGVGRVAVGGCIVGSKQMPACRRENGSCNKGPAPSFDVAMLLLSDVGSKSPRDGELSIWCLRSAGGKAARRQATVPSSH